VESGVRRWRRPIITFAGLIVIYYAIPTGVAANGAFAIGILFTTVAVIALAWAITGQVRRQIHGGTDVAMQSLLTLIELVVVVFAFGFYQLEQARPGELADLDTRTDALYFTVSTMATIGYGDVHAVGQVARVIVLIQMAFNIVFVGALASIVSGRVRRHTESPSDRPDPAGTDERLDRRD
jgi:voltage-gated potassium channel